MDTEETLHLKEIRRRVEAVNADLSRSTFDDVNLSGTTFRDVSLSAASMQDVNLAVLEIRDANLTGASIAESKTDGMTIDGIPVSELLAAYRAARATS